MTTVLYFSASWCGPCRNFKKTWEVVSTSDLKDTIEFKMVDVDKDNEITEKYEIRQVPTFVVVKDGKEVKRASGAMPEATFREWVNVK